jgi:CheY-like chemotaxis protein/anti-sigma regulatory factor (Ser/Thr protein kinase)
MSHELRTPLNAIIGFSDLMRMEEPDGDRRRVPAEWVDHIHTSGRHLLGLINDILDLAKVEAGRLDLRLGPLRVDTAVTELLTGLAPLLCTKHLSVITDMAEVTALADRLRFRQIVENLLSNAIKFTPEGGELTVSIVGTEDHVFVTVADTGVGIDAADQERVFEEFQQVGDPDRQRAGTGLGLALTKRLVEAHEGEITLVSAPGEGSSFTVRLPAASVIRQVTVDSVDPDKGTHAARVLLIEDDAQSAELMQAQLHAAGYRVDVAGSGEAGLTAAGAHPPDAIVLDVTLPGMDGWEVIRRLKADDRLAGIPVFFASIVDERQTGLALGADGYFVKPIDQAALLGAMARTLAARATPRVLVVDHDDAVREAIEEGLRAGGADVVACADGRDGIALSREGNFDLIVCDMRSPEVDGFSLLAAIEQDPATRHTPVLGLSTAAAADRPPGDAAPLVATAMAGGVVAAAMAGGAGWETLTPLLGNRPAARKDEP